MTTVRLDTSLGAITVELFAEEAPVTVANFLSYLDDGFFDGTIFHRVIPGFVIQGGGFTPDMRHKPGRDKIRNEADNGLKNERGTLSMARTNDIDSATSQFFINLDDNTSLDHTPDSFGYAVFGRVTEGLDVVDAIAAVDTTTRDVHQNVPAEPVTIRTASRTGSA